MRSTLLLAVVLVVWVGQGLSDGDVTTEASTDPKKEDQDSSSEVGFKRPPPQPQPQPKDDEDVSSDEVDDDPNALDDQSCDELWDQTKKEEVKLFPDEIVEWMNLCAMKHGLCVLAEPYWSTNLIHTRVLFPYKHDYLTVTTRVSTTFEERCSNPAVDWEKIGEKYRLKDQLRYMRRRYPKRSKSSGKRRHQRRSTAANPQ